MTHVNTLYYHFLPMRYDARSCVYIYIYIYIYIYTHIYIYIYAYIIMYTVEPPYFELIGNKLKLWLQTFPYLKLSAVDILNGIDDILISSFISTSHYEKYLFII